MSCHDERKKIARLMCAVVVSCLVIAAGASAQVPHLIRYQGQAVDSKGVTLEGPYTLIFRLYDAETGGAKLWEEPQANVLLEGGHFSVLLGQVASLDAMDWSKPCWLSVQVNSDPELAPRQRITSVPLAVRAESAERLTQAITPALITPQGSGSGLDADTVDGKHASDLLNRANHTGTEPSSAAWIFVETLSGVGTTLTSATLSTASDIFMLVFDGVAPTDNVVGTVKIQFNGSATGVLTVWTFTGRNQWMTGNIIFERAPITSVSAPTTIPVILTILTSAGTPGTSAYVTPSAVPVTSVSLVNSSSLDMRVHLFRLSKQS